jgi:cytochrome c oxidase subunit 2
MVSKINQLFGIPELASEHGELVDHMLGFVHWFMLILFVGWSIYLGWVFYRYNQKRNRRADYVGVRGHATTHIEIGVVIVEAILLLGFRISPLGQASRRVSNFARHRETPCGR